MSKLAGLAPEEFQTEIERRRRNRMALVDAMPDDIRTLVHEYGLGIVLQMHAGGVTQARHIRCIVETVLNELSPARQSWSAQGPRTATASPNGVPTGWKIVPIEPTEAMIDASQETLENWRAGLTPDERTRRTRIVDGHPLTYMRPRDKHAARYRAMLAAAPKPEKPT